MSYRRVLPLLASCSIAGWAACASEVNTSSTSSQSSASTSQGSGGLGGSASGVGEGATGGQGGGAPPQTMCEDFSGAALIASKLYLGDTDFNDVPSASAWKMFGFDLDGLVSTKTSIDLCKPSAGGSPAAVYPDGENGIDNAFGKLLLPIFSGLAADFSKQINDTIKSGQGSTILIKLDDLGGSPNQNPVVSKVYATQATSFPPKFDGTDCWPVAYESVSDPADADTALVVFKDAAVMNDVWTSGTKGTVQLVLGVAGYAMRLTVQHARLSMKLDATHESATLGQIGGVIDTEEFVAELKKVAGSFDISLCSGATFESLADQIRQASDILSDGTQDPNKTCNAISIGIGFDATAVRFGHVAPKAPPPPDPCAE